MGGKERASTRRKEQVKTSTESNRRCTVVRAVVVSIPEVMFPEGAGVSRLEQLEKYSAGA